MTPEAPLQRLLRLLAVGGHVSAQVQVIPDATEVGYALRGADGVLVRGARSRSTAAKTQLVLRLLSADPAPSYAEISAAIGIPTGSIGPTRVRVLHRLRTLLEQGLIA